MVLPFASIVDRRKRLQRDLTAHMIANIPGFLPTTIPDATVVEQMGVERAPVATFAPKSAAAAAFRQLWADVAARLWK